MVGPVCVLEVQLHCTSHDWLYSNFFIFPQQKHTIALCTVLAVVFGETLRIRKAWIQFSWYGKFHTLSLVSSIFPSTKIYSLTLSCAVICTLFHRFKCVFRLSCWVSTNTVFCPELYYFHFHIFLTWVKNESIYRWCTPQRFSEQTLMRVGEFLSLSQRDIQQTISRAQSFTLNFEP